MRIPHVCQVCSLALLFLACSSTPTPVAERRPVPSDRIFQSGLASRGGQRTAELTFARDQGYFGSGLGIDVFLDGSRVARLAIGESITIFATPREHLIGARWSHGDAPPTEREFILGGTPKRIRVTLDQDGNLDVKPESGLLCQSAATRAPARGGSSCSR